MRAQKSIPTTIQAFALALTLGACSPSPAPGQTPHPTFTVVTPTPINRPTDGPPATDPPIATPPPSSSDVQVTTTHGVSFTEEGDCGPARCALQLDVFEPELPGTHPVAVLIPGSPGGPGHRTGLTEFAVALAKTGVLVFNADYRSAESAGPFPIPVGDAACAVRFARAHAAEHRGDPSRILLLGHSLGGYVALLEGLGAPADQTDCLAAGEARVSAIVALEPPFRPTPDDEFWTDFMGGTIAQLPDAYAAADTSAYVGTDRDVVVRVLWGDEVWAELLSSPPDLLLVQQLADAGYNASMAELFGADHFGGIDVRQAADQTIALIHELPGFAQ